jgi:hypothetical protein
MTRGLRIGILGLAISAASLAGTLDSSPSPASADAAQVEARTSRPPTRL